MVRLAFRCFRPRLAGGCRATQACREGELGIDKVLTQTDCGYPFYILYPKTTTTICYCIYHSKVDSLFIMGHLADFWLAFL